MERGEEREFSESTVWRVKRILGTGSLAIAILSHIRDADDIRELETIVLSISSDSKLHEATCAAFLRADRIIFRRTCKVG
jgi:hypothetical protein